MPKFTVRSPLAHDGKRYSPKDEIELSEKAAAALPAGTVVPAAAETQPAKAGKAGK
ncbi:MAG: hypothetical protein ACOY5V_00160 [Pseudomonadota bacterium]